jgi:hypothetical protein
MREHWKLPDEKAFSYSGKDWLQILIGHTDELTKSRILLLLWRSWHLRNDIIHAEGKETIARSVAFLMSYACEQTTESTIEPGSPHGALHHQVG